MQEELKRVPVVMPAVIPTVAGEGCFDVHAALFDNRQHIDVEHVHGRQAPLAHVGAAKGVSALAVLHRLQVEAPPFRAAKKNVSIATSSPV